MKKIFLSLLCGVVGLLAYAGPASIDEAVCQAKAWEEGKDSETYAVSNVHPYLYVEDKTVYIGDEYAYANMTNQLTINIKNNGAADFVGSLEIKRKRTSFVGTFYDKIDGATQQVKIPAYETVGVTFNVMAPYEGEIDSIVVCDTLNPEEIIADLSYRFYKPAVLRANSEMCFNTVVFRGDNFRYDCNLGNDGELVYDNDIYVNFYAKDKQTVVKEIRLEKIKVDSHGETISVDANFDDVAPGGYYVVPYYYQTHTKQWVPLLDVEFFSPRRSVIVENVSTEGAFIRLKNNIDGENIVYLNAPKSEDSFEPAGFSLTKDANSILYYRKSKGILTGYNSGLYLVPNESLNSVGTHGLKDHIGKFMMMSNLDSATTGFEKGDLEGNGEMFNLYLLYVNLDSRSTGLLDINNDDIDSYMAAFLDYELVTSLPVHLNNAGNQGNYATLYTPVALDITAAEANGLKAYIGKLSDDNSELVLTRIKGAIPANTGVILWSATATDVELPIATTKVEPLAEGANSLVGQVETKANDGLMTYFSLNQNAGNVGFYKYNGNLNGFRARLALPKDTQTKGFSISFGDDEITAIEEVEVAEEPTMDIIYDLSGRRVVTPEKGVYIVNGKKVFVK